MCVYRNNKRANALRSHPRQLRRCHGGHLLARQSRVPTAHRGYILQPGTLFCTCTRSPRRSALKHRYLTSASNTGTTESQRVSAETGNCNRTGSVWGSESVARRSNGEFGSSLVCHEQKTKKTFLFCRYFSRDNTKSEPPPSRRQNIDKTSTKEVLPQGERRVLSTGTPLPRAGTLRAPKDPKSPSRIPCVRSCRSGAALDPSCDEQCTSTS